MENNTATWQLTEVASPNINEPVPVVAAKNILYIPGGNRFQNISIYLPRKTETEALVGTLVASLPGLSPVGKLPRWHVHIHGGAWRDPQLTSASIEPAVAHAFLAANKTSPLITAVASINYTLSPFPAHPTLPYDPTTGDHSDPSREAYHPEHVHDVLAGFALLRSLGLQDDSYILSGHSAGSCLSFQSTLQPASYWHANPLPDPPRPAAILGLNGLYDLWGLVHDLGESHASLDSVYRTFLSITFGADQTLWPAASPASFDLSALNDRMKVGKIARLVVLDQSKEDQLVPMNQVERFQAHLTEVDGLRLVRGHRCEGRHVAPWEEGYMIWDSIQDVLQLLSEE
ncbi:hypothetical protein GQ53DRAFT_860606 [Thozetella sp. PMI_491]|nr:hypothetical protein GQ53DRAFT_860606 [Thozetella sp. PMI_491]